MSEDSLYFVSETPKGNNPEVVEFLDGELPQISGMGVEQAKAAHVKNKEKIMGIERKHKHKCGIVYRTKPKLCKCQMKKEGMMLKICEAKHGSWFPPEEDFTSCHECDRVLNEFTPKQKKHEELNSMKRQLRALETKRILDQKKEGERRKEHENKVHDAKILAKAMCDEQERRNAKKK